MTGGAGGAPSAARSPAGFTGWPLEKGKERREREDPWMEGSRV